MTNLNIDVLQQELFENIFLKLQDYLPSNWVKIDFFASKTSGSYGIKYFVYNKDGKWVDCFNLVDIKEIKNLFYLIGNDISTVWEQLPKQNKWYSFNLVIDNQGNLKVDYDYADNIKEEELFSYLFNKQKQWSAKFK